MTHPTTARELLIVEALGEAARLIRQIEALAPVLDESCQTLVKAHAQLVDQLAAFEAQLAALTDKAKVQTVKHLLARTEEAARHAIAQQGRAMADAARVAFDAELGATLQRRPSAWQPEQPEWRWTHWLTHAAAATVASAATWAVAVMLGPR